MTGPPAAPPTAGTPIARGEITGIVLAGGQGRRMGGVDKGLVQLDGKPLAQHVISRLAPQVGTLIVNANQNAERYAAFGYPVVADAVGGFAGPLAGLHAGMAQADGTYVATAPCDSPFLPADLVSRLAAALVAANAQLAVARTFDQPHPVLRFLLEAVRRRIVRFGLLVHRRPAR